MRLGGLYEKVDQMPKGFGLAVFLSAGGVGVPASGQITGMLKTMLSEMNADQCIATATEIAIARV